jgi:hypothetical protein
VNIIRKEVIQMFDSPYDLYTYEDGSKKLHCKQDKDGFEIEFIFSGDQEKHKKAIKAIEDFFVKINL